MTHRFTPKEIHTHRKNLAKRIQTCTDKSFMIAGSEALIRSKYGNVVTENSNSTLAVKGKIYKIKFVDDHAIVYTKPIDPFTSK